MNAGKPLATLALASQAALFEACGGETRRAAEPAPQPVTSPEPVGEAGAQSLPFDPALWKACSERQDLEKRYWMLADLFARYPLVGMHADQIETLLGPLREGRAIAGGTRYAYWMEPPTWQGQESGGFGRVRMLLLDFDQEERVVTYHLVPPPPKPGSPGPDPPR